MATEKTRDEPTFEARLQRLEELVEALEEGGLELEPAIERYQEGIQLLKECHGVLATYRQRVEELTGEAEAALEPFAADPDAAQAGTGRA